MSRRAAVDDSGFTLVETLVSIMLISVVMGGLTAFYSTSIRTSSLETQTQTAVQFASSAMELVVRLPGKALLEGRAPCAVTSQWQSAPAATRSKFLDSMGQLSDSDLVGTVCPAGAALKELLASTAPAVPMRVDVGRPIAGGPSFGRDVYIGQCFQAPGLNALAGGASTNDVSCLPTGSSSAMPMLRVVIEVTWPSARCPASGCSYVTSTLIPARTADLTFS